MNRRRGKMKTLIIVLIVLLNIVSFAQSSNLAEKLAEYNLQLVNKISIGSSPDEVKKILGKPAVVEAGFPESDEMLFYDEFPSDQAGQLNYTTWFYKFTKKKITYTVYADTTYMINGEVVPIDIYEFYLDKDSIYYYPLCLINDQLISINLYQSYLNKDSVYYNRFGSIDYAPKTESPETLKQMNNSEVRDNDASRNARLKSPHIGETKGHYSKIKSQKFKLDKMILSTVDITLNKKTYALVKKKSQEMKIMKQHKKSDTFLPILCIVFEKGTNVVATTKAYFQWL